MGKFNFLFYQCTVEHGRARGIDMQYREKAMAEKDRGKERIK